MLPLVSAIVLSASSLLTPAIGPPPQVVGEATVAKIIQYVEAVRRSEIIDYVVADQQGKLTAYVDALAASDAIVAAESQPVPQTPQRATQSVSGGGGGFLDCVVQRESGGNPQAHNPSSSASGLFQDLTGTWQHAAVNSGVPGASQYPTAADAPPDIQWAVNQWLYSQEGTAPWAGGNYSC